MHVLWPEFRPHWSRFSGPGRTDPLSGRPRPVRSVATCRSKSILELDVQFLRPDANNQRFIFIGSLSNHYGRRGKFMLFIIYACLNKSKN